MARAILILLFLVLVFHYLGAQTVPVTGAITGTLTGTVVDSSGAPLVGSTIRLLGTRQGGLSKAPDARFTISGIRPGQYTAEIASLGRAKVQRQATIVAGVTTDLGAVVLGDATAVGQRCVVTGKRELVARERTGSVRSIGRTDIVGMVTQQSGTTNGFAIRGGRASNTSIRVDGVAITDAYSGGNGNTATAIYPSVSSLAVQETQVVPSGFPAQYGDVLSGLVGVARGPDEFVPDRTVGATAPEIEVTPVNPYAERSGERYQTIYENPFIAALTQRFSTFSIDVDAASYSIVRSYVNGGTRPPADAVRIEELINYFDYAYPDPTDEHPFSLITEISECPWNRDHKLVQVAIQGRRLDVSSLPPANLVFLIDVSGSMDQPDKLPLVQKAFRLLVEQLRPEDQVAIVVYAGAAGLVLPTTSGADRATILSAIDRLEAGGSTAGGAGIVLAYETAKKSFLSNGNNRVILATDGDFNVGVSDDDALVELIEKKRNEGIYLSVLGFGTGNYQDAKMEKLADKGNGNYAYVDNISEAKKVFVNQMGATLLTIAKDVKIQLEFDPSRVREYRLIGYENRMLAKEDFDDDAKDAGELGAGHSVTALYEVVPVGAAMSGEWQGRPDTLDMPGADGSGLMQVRLRYKLPTSSTSQLIESSVVDRSIRLTQTSESFRFAVAVAEFGLLLRSSRHAGTASFDEVLRLAESARSHDPFGYRAEFVEMVRIAAALRAAGGE